MAPKCGIKQFEQYATADCINLYDLCVPNLSLIFASIRHKFTETLCFSIKRTNRKVEQKQNNIYP